MKNCKICGYANDDRATICMSCRSSLEEKKGNRIWLAVTGGVVVVAAFLVIAFVLFYNSSAQVYKRSIEGGDKYALIMRYEDAILSYRTAISALPKKDEGYLKLADVYYMIGDMENAKDVLLEGQLYTQSVKIISMLDEMEAVENTQEKKNTVLQTTQVTEAELVKMSEEVILYSQMLKVFSRYNYGDYRRDYGEPDWTLEDNGVCKGTFDGNATVLLYYNTPDNPDVINERQGVPHTYSMPTEITVNSVALLFENYAGGITYQKLTQLCGQTLQVAYNESEKCNYVKFSAEGCWVEIETDKEGNIVGDSVWNRIIPMSYTQEAEEVRMSTVSGYVKDAATGLGIYGALLSIKQSGTEIGQYYSTGDGSYEVQLSAGKYEVEVSYGDYITETFEVEIREGENLFNTNFTLSPKLEQGSIRIVLEWGNSPMDLDSHTSGVFSNGSSFWINYGNRIVSSGGNVLAELDVDDVNGFGPETTTIYDSGSVFTFWIEDFRNEGCTNFSNVTVKVYLPDQSVPIVYTGSQKDFGIKRWKVFSYENGQVSFLDLYE